MKSNADSDCEWWRLFGNCADQGFCQNLIKDDNDGLGKLWLWWNRRCRLFSGWWCWFYDNDGDGDYQIHEGPTAADQDEVTGEVEEEKKEEEGTIS